MYFHCLHYKVSVGRGRNATPSHCQAFYHICYDPWHGHAVAAATAPLRERPPTLGAWGQAAGATSGGPEHPGQKTGNIYGSKVHHNLGKSLNSPPVSLVHIAGPWHCAGEQVNGGIPLPMTPIEQYVSMWSVQSPVPVPLCSQPLPPMPVPHSSNGSNMRSNHFWEGYSWKANAAAVVCIPYWPRKFLSRTLHFLCAQACVKFMVPGCELLLKLSVHACVLLWWYTHGWYGVVLGHVCPPHPISPGLCGEAIVPRAGLGVDFPNPIKAMDGLGS